jgi:hypothetical protein
MKDEGGVRSQVMVWREEKDDEERRKEEVGIE